MDEEEAMMWQDALEEILAGRAGSASCPFCGTQPILVERTGLLTKVSCPQCQKFVEGKFGGNVG